MVVEHTPIDTLERACRIGYAAASPMVLLVLSRLRAHTASRTALAALALAATPSLAQADDDQPLAIVDVVRIMAGRRPAIRAACFDAQGKPTSSLRVDFVIGAAGTVTDARPNDAKGPQPVIECVLAEVRKTTFPSSVDGGAFQWPFVFKGP